MTLPGIPSTRTPPLDQRVGDEDRERCATQLADAFASGRLTGVEHGERLEHAWAAVTAADLRDLVHDLPEPLPPGPGSPGDVVHPSAPRMTPVLAALVFQFVLVVVAFCAGVDLESELRSAALIAFEIWAVGTAGAVAGVVLGRSLSRTPRGGRPQP